jgi:hypothetical protein
MVAFQVKSIHFRSWASIARTDKRSVGFQGEALLFVWRYSMFQGTLQLPKTPKDSNCNTRHIQTTVKARNETL